MIEMYGDFVAILCCEQFNIVEMLAFTGAKGFPRGLQVELAWGQGISRGIAGRARARPTVQDHLPGRLGDEVSKAVAWSAW